MGVSQTAQQNGATRAGRGGNHPPEHTKWKKGCPPPNPKGRPSMKRFKDAARAILAQVDPRTQKSGAETLVELAYRRARQGNVKQLQILLAYAEGRPAQNVNVSGGVLHAWRPLSTLTDEQVEQLAAIRKSLSAPEGDESGPVIEAEVERS